MGLKLGVEIFGVEMSATLVLSEQSMLHICILLHIFVVVRIRRRGKVLGPSKYFDFPFF